MVKHKLFAIRLQCAVSQNVLQAIFNGLKAVYVDPDSWDDSIHDPKLKSKIKIKIDRIRTGMLRRGILYKRDGLNGNHYSLTEAGIFDQGECSDPEEERKLRFLRKLLQSWQCEHLFCKVLDEFRQSKLVDEHSRVSVSPLPPFEVGQVAP
jgi:hypothetical protein